MYSSAGKRLINLVLAGKRPALATHIALGINTVYDASIDGVTQPYAHNYISSPYIVEYIKIKNIGVVSTGGPATEDEIVFNGEADVSKQYVANNMGLVSSPQGTEPQQYIIANVASEVWFDGSNPPVNIEPTPSKIRFSNEGVIATSNIATYNNTITLTRVDDNSIIAMPLFIVSTGSPVSGTVSISLTYTLNSTIDTITYQGNIVAATGGGYKFAHDNQWNVAANTVINGNPVPFLFQRRLNSDTTNVGSGSTKIRNLLDPKTIINQLTVVVTGGLTIQFGNIIIAPTIDDSFDLTNVSHRRLSSVLYKTEDEAYVNAEYRIRGVV